MHSTDFEQREAVVEVVLQTLGDSVVGIYHYGSAVLGGLRLLSDLDLLVVVDRPTSGQQRQRLVEEILPVSGGRSARIVGRPVEITVVLQGAVKPSSPELEREFQYGEWLREDYVAGWVPEPVSDPDLAPLLASVLAASVPVFGPPADDVIAPVPQDTLVASMRDAVPSLIADLDTDTTNVLLTLARMWHTKDSGAIVSKDEAADRVLHRLPRNLRPPLEHAREVYLGREDASFERFSDGALSTAQHLSMIISES